MLYPMNGAPPLSVQCSFSLGSTVQLVLLADQAMLDVIAYIYMHA